MNGRGRSHVSPLVHELAPLSCVSLADHLPPARGVLLAIRSWIDGKEAKRSLAHRRVSPNWANSVKWNRFDGWNSLPVVNSYPRVSGLTGEEKGCAGQVTLQSHQRGKVGHVSDLVCGSIKSWCVRRRKGSVRLDGAANSFISRCYSAPQAKLVCDTWQVRVTGDTIVPLYVNSIVKSPCWLVYG